MTVTADSLLASGYLENSQTTKFTSSAVRTIIDKCTVTNVTATAATVAINLVASGGAAGTSNVVLQTRTIQPSETYLCPEIVGHILSAGDFVSGIAGTASAIVIRMSGRKVS